MTQTPRKSEPAKLWYRSERIFSSNGHWYFATREGIDVGPFESMSLAEVEVGLLTKKLRRSTDVEAMAHIKSILLEAESCSGDLRSNDFVDYVVEMTFEEAKAAAAA